MQHKITLIAAAVTTSLFAATTTASAEITVYGKIHTSVASVSADAGTSYNATEIKSNSSRLGFKSSKNLENDMIVSGKAEFEVDAAGDTTQSSTDLIKLRNTYIGLKGNFGEVRIGRHDTPHKISTGNMDLFSDTYADMNNIIQNDNRVSNTIIYLNKFGPIGIAASYAAGADTATATGENTGASSSLMANYTAGPIYVTGAIESFSDTSAGDIEDAKKAGLGYKIGALDLGLVYETLAIDSGKRVNETYISAMYKMSSNTTLKAAYGMRDTRIAGVDEAVMTAAGVDYKLDEQASVYALYANGSDGGLEKKGKLAGDSSALGLGFVYKF